MLNLISLKWTASINIFFILTDAWNLKPDWGLSIRRGPFQPLCCCLPSMARLFHFPPNCCCCSHFRMFLRRPRVKRPFVCNTQ